MSVGHERSSVGGRHAEKSVGNRQIGRSGNYVTQCVHILCSIDLMSCFRRSRTDVEKHWKDTHVNF